MRYRILKPSSHIDIRKHTFTSLDALEIIACPIGLTPLDSEDEAVVQTRLFYPDAIGMPVAVTVGSGQMWLMAFVDDHADRELDSAAEIPFVMFVRAVPESTRDRLRIAQHAMFDQKKWRPPIHRPLVTGCTVHPVEIRATDLPTPMHASALVGKTADGSPVIVLEVAGVQMSIRFERAREIHIENKSDPARSVGLHEGVGASYDPNPH